MKKRKRKRKGNNRSMYKSLVLTLIVIVIVIQSVILVNNYTATPEPARLPKTITNTPTDIPLSLDGYEEVEVSVTPSVIYLQSGCQQLAMITTDFQTYSIQNGIDSRVDYRPTTHDVMSDLIDNLGVEVKMARIERFEDSTYYAKLFVQQSNKLLGLDARPSDTIAVAVRFDAPVYVQSSILESEGKSIC